MFDWLFIIVALAFPVLVINPGQRDFHWFRSLRRPAWLAVFVWLPVLWLLIQFSILISSLIVWHRFHSLPLLLVAGLVILLQECRTWLMCRFRSLTLGGVLQLAAWICALVLVLRTAPIDTTAALLLLPMLLWSPLEVIALHQMGPLNRD
jgi:tryptophan-rich sensory protein